MISEDDTNRELYNLTNTGKSIRIELNKNIITVLFLFSFIVMTDFLLGNVLLNFPDSNLQLFFHKFQTISIAIAVFILCVAHIIFVFNKSIDVVKSVRNLVIIFFAFVAVLIVVNSVLFLFSSFSTLWISLSNLFFVIVLFLVLFNMYHLLDEFLVTKNKFCIITNDSSILGKDV